MCKSDKNAATELAKVLGVTASIFIQYLTETKADRSQISYLWATEGNHVALDGFFMWLNK
jgi:hypothetical protein